MTVPVYPENAVILAPLAGHTDLPMRRSCRRHGCRYAFTEMIDAGSLVHSNFKSNRLAERGSDEEFLGIQLVGSEPETLDRAVDIVNSGEYSVLDFNLGCPAPKVKKKGEGAAFASQRPEDAVRAVERIVRRSRIPVTVKTRILAEQDPEPTVKFVKALESTGISALTLHGRIAKVFYAGEPDYAVMRAVRESLAIPVIANGGVMGRDSYDKLRAETGCSRVMIARGALGNPWLFREVSCEEYIPPTVSELAEEMHRHVLEMIEFYGEETGFPVSRKTVLDYLRGRGYPGALRAEAARLSSFADLDRLCEIIRQGPAEGYWTWLRTNPGAPRRLSPENPGNPEKPESLIPAQ